MIADLFGLVLGVFLGGIVVAANQISAESGGFDIRRKFGVNFGPMWKKR